METLVCSGLENRVAFTSLCPVKSLSFTLDVGTMFVLIVIVISRDSLPHSIESTLGCMALRPASVLEALF